jgi:low affinity Fe/Cu permease
MATAPSEATPWTRKVYELGCRISDRGANIAGHPASIMLVVIFCAAWFVSLGSGFENTLTLILSVAAITLTQMVLNQQKRHDAALHMKIDELIHAMKGARNEIAGIEHKTEAELEALRDTGDVAEQVLEERRRERA